MELQNTPNIDIVSETPPDQADVRIPRQTFEQIKEVLRDAQWRLSMISRLMTGNEDAYTSQDIYNLAYYGKIDILLGQITTLAIPTPISSAASGSQEAGEPITLNNWFTRQVSFVQGRPLFYLYGEMPNRTTECVGFVVGHVGDCVYTYCGGRFRLGTPSGPYKLAMEMLYQQGVDVNRLFLGQLAEL